MPSLFDNFLIALPIAFLGGFLPSLIWLWFWLREDNMHPEPRRRIAKCFLAGMVAVIAVLPFEKLVSEYFSNTGLIFLLWATIEELFKFIAAYLLAFTNRDYDEPIDAVIYMITAAIGFAALENTFYILTPLSQGLVYTSFITGNMRFIGSTLLHTVASASVGIIIAFRFYKPHFSRLFLLVGLSFAISLHTLFNISIIQGDGNSAVFTFYSVWAAVIILILVFEKVKRIRA